MKEPDSMCGRPDLDEKRTLGQSVQPSITISRGALERAIQIENLWSWQHKPQCLILIYTTHYILFFIVYEIDKNCIHTLLLFYTCLTERNMNPSFVIRKLDSFETVLTAQRVWPLNKLDVKMLMISFFSWPTSI
jgi:hypothetical protein